MKVKVTLNKFVVMDVRIRVQITLNKFEITNTKI